LAEISEQKQLIAELRGIRGKTPDRLDEGAKGVGRG